MRTALPFALLSSIGFLGLAACAEQPDDVTLASRWMRDGDFSVAPSGESTFTLEAHDLVALGPGGRTGPTRSTTLVVERLDDEGQRLFRVELGRQAPNEMREACVEGADDTTGEWGVTCEQIVREQGDVSIAANAAGDAALYGQGLDLSSCGVASGGAYDPSVAWLAPDGTCARAVVIEGGVEGARAMALTSAGVVVTLAVTLAPSGGPTYVTTVSAVDAGGESWRATVDGEYELLATRPSDGMVAIANELGTVRQFSPDGAVLGAFHDDALVTSIAYAEDGALAVAGLRREGGSLVGLAPTGRPMWARTFDEGIDFVATAPDGGWLLAASSSEGLGGDALLHTDAFGEDPRSLGVVSHVRVTSLRLLPEGELVIGGDWSDFARLGDRLLEGPPEVGLAALGRLAPAE